MRSTLFIILICFYSFGISNSQWVQVTNGMGNGTDISSFTMKSDIIFTGTFGNGIFVSTNYGTSWELSFFGLYNQWFTSLAVNGNNIFVGIYGGALGSGGVYLSTNNGTNWTQTSLNNIFIRSIVENGNHIFAGTDYGVYSTVNNGENWSQTGLNNRTVMSLALNEDNIYAGCMDYGVYLSTDNGLNWVQSALNNLSISSLAVNGNKVFCGTVSNGVYYSANGGSSWEHTSLDTITYVTSIAINGNNIFAGSFYSGFSVSTDNGANWLQRNEGFNFSTSVHTLFITNNYIFAGTRGHSVYRRPLSEVIGIQSVSTEIPEDFSLSQNYPNPFNPSTKIQFQIPLTELVDLKVYDILGNEAAVLVYEQLKPGIYEADWNAEEFPSGVYFYRINAGTFSESKKMMLVK